MVECTPLSGLQLLQCGRQCTQLVERTTAVVMLKLCYYAAWMMTNWRCRLQRTVVGRTADWRARTTQSTQGRVFQFTYWKCEYETHRKTNLAVCCMTRRSAIADCTARHVWNMKHTSFLLGQSVPSGPNFTGMGSPPSKILILFNR